MKSEHYTTEGVKVLQLQDIGEGEFINKSNVFVTEEKANELSSCNIFPDDIILAKMAPVARCCKIPKGVDRYVMCSDGIRLSVDKEKYNTEFVFQALSSKYFRKIAEAQSTGTTRARIGLNDLKLIPIAIPSEINEQQKIATILRTVDEKIEVIEEQIKETETLKKGLMQQLLTKGIGHTKFKNSPLGEIPESWEVVNLNNLVNPKRPIRYGIVQTGENVPDGIPCLRVADFSKVRFDKSLMIKTSKEISDSYKQTVLIENDIVFPLRGCIGNVRVIKQQNAGINLTRGVALISYSKKINPSYLSWQIISQKVGKEILLQVNGTTLKEVPISGLKKILIPVASPAEQLKISEVLDAVDEKLEVLQARKENFQELKKGLMQQLLTGKMRVNLN